MTHDLVERLRDPNYSGSMQHLRSYDEIDRLFNQAADKLETYMADADAHVSRIDLVRRQEDEIRDLKAENATLRAERDAAFAMSKCECGADEACANLARLRADLEQSRSVEETTHGLYQFWNKKAAELAASNDALRAEKDEIRKAVIEEAAAICERQAKYFRDLSNDPSCLSDIRWNSREEASHTMQSYAERHEVDAAAIRNMGERT